MSRDNSLDRPELSVVVPLFNEEVLVPELVRRLAGACAACTESFELLFINDGSRDRTLSLLVEESAKRPELVVLDLSRNFGHMAALMAGLTRASGWAVVVMDGDLQDPPELIPKLMEKWHEGAEVVLAQRTARMEGWGQKALTRFFYRLVTSISEVPMPEQVGTLCLLDRQAVDAINKMPERIRYFAGLRAWVGFRTAVVAYQRQARTESKTKVGLGGQFRLGRIALVSFSKWPLIWLPRFSLVVSVGLCIFGFSVVGIKLFSDLAIPGWASTMVLIGIVASLHSAVLAVLSEYMAVLFDEIKQRPSFVTSGVYRHGKPIEES